MLQKFNITTYAVVLCLFGFMLFSAAPVFANNMEGFNVCVNQWEERTEETKTDLSIKIFVSEELSLSR